MADDRRPGRPALDPNNPSVNVHVRLPPRQYDDIYQKAQRERVSIPEVIRRSLERDADDED